MRRSPRPGALRPLARLLPPLYHPPQTRRGMPAITSPRAGANRSKDVQGDDASQFKLFRILWFPLSINAMLLGALSIIAFIVLTGIACLATGDHRATMAASRAFLPSVLHVAKGGSWPGFATAERDGVYVHHALAKDDANTEVLARARAETEQIKRLFGSYADDRIAGAGGEGAELAKNREEIAKSLSRTLPRYRTVFLIQLAGVLFLLSTSGVAICRLLALRIARDEYCPISEAIGYAWRVKLTGLLYPLAVLLPICMLAIANQAGGLVVSIPFLGGLLGIFIYPLIALSSLIISLCLLVAVFCLGLMPAAIATERKGTYDCLGKAFNYVFARPIPVILHSVAVLAFLYVLHWLFLEQRAVEQIIAATGKPLFGGAQMEAVFLGQTEGLTGWKWFHAKVFDILLTIYALFVRGALISLLLGALTALFLMLRHDVDGINTSEVARDPAHHKPPPPPSAPAAEPATPAS